MFGYLRLFSILSLMVVVLVAVVAGMSFRTLQIEGVQRMMELNNAGLSQGYIDGVWKRYREILVPVTPENTERLKDPVVAQFAQETVQYFQRMPLLRVNIYNVNGLLLMSVDTSNTYNLNKLDIKTPSVDSKYVSERLNRPTVESAIREGVPGRAIREDLPGSGDRKLTVLQNVVPIRMQLLGDNDGVLEMLYDMSAPVAQLEQFQMIGTAGFIGLFFVFLVILFLSSKRAETIIAKQHEGNLELAASAAAAQAESAEKSQFLANISHELRTPLNAIIGFSDIIKTEAMPQVEDRKYHNYINDIHSSGVHLLSLINDILDYSKAEAGKLELEVSEVNVSKLVQNTMRLVTPRAQAGAIQLTEALPKTPIVMVTDSKKFRQILLNLLSNAVKFTPENGEVKISAWHNVADDSYSFEVKDSGIGIAPKDISRAMTPFGQVDNTFSRKYEGTGLGLPLTKKFVELMGGKFMIESEVGKGTTIIFTLPKEVKEREGVKVKRQEES